MRAATAENPLAHLEDWDDYVASRYQEGKAESEFRNDLFAEFLPEKLAW